MTLEDLIREWRGRASKELDRVRTDQPERAPIHLATATTLKQCARELELALTQTSLFG